MRKHRAVAVSCVLAFMMVLPLRGGAERDHEAANQVTITGTSNVRDWSCVGEAQVEVSPDSSVADPIPGFPAGVQAATILVVVEALNCDDDKKMTEHMRKSLKAKEYPVIMYAMDRYAVKDNGSVRISGKLTIAGVTRSADLEATLSSIPEGGFAVVGSVTIDMRDFGVKPPTALMGLVKADPVINVQFHAAIGPCDQ